MILALAALASIAHAAPNELIERELQGWEEPLLAAASGVEDVIIILKEPAELATTGREAARLKTSEKRALREEMRERIASRPAVHEKRRYASMNALAATVSAQERAALEQHPLVKSVHKDITLHATMAQTVGIINATGVWATQVYGENLTGKGQTVCVIDTGIDYTHPSLGGCTIQSVRNRTCQKTILAYDFVNSDDDPYDDHGHGTHVAGTIAADGSVVGVAPDARLAVAKALAASGSGSASDIAAAIEWCTNNSAAYNISVISMSLGGGNYTGACDASFPYFATPIDAATAKNISVVVATGNEGNWTHISTPACIASSIAVASVSESDVMSTFSSRNDQALLVAPGESITSTYPGGGTATSQGTSMATPHVSATIALLNHYLTLAGGSRTPGAIETLLSQNGVTVFDAASGRNYTRIDAGDALRALDLLAPTTTDDAPEGWTNASLNVTLTATDAGSGVDYTTYALDGGPWTNGTLVTVAGAGIHNLSYYSTDQFGHVESVRNATIRIDVVAPVTTDDAPAGWQRNATITLSATDDRAGVDATWTRIGNATWANQTIVSITASGNHTLAYYSVDAAGNAENTTNLAVLVDQDAPHTMSDLNSSWQNQSFTITLTPTDAHSGVNHTSFHNGSWQNGTSIAITTSGAHTITYRSTDNLNNTEENQTITARLDLEAPVSELSTPNGWQRLPFTVQANATDAHSGVSVTLVRLDNGSWQNQSVNVTTDGNHTITYYSVDNAGNPEAIRNATALLDTAAPSVNLTSIPTRIGAGYTFSVAAAASDENLANLTATLGNATSLLSWNGSAYTADVLAGAAGAATLTLTATDLAGNQALQNTSITIHEMDVIAASLNQTTSINLSVTLRANLTVRTNQSTQTNISVLSSTQAPGFVGALERAVRYIDIEAAGLAQSMEWALITITYNDTEVAGLDPATLRIAWHNGTGWEDLSTARHAWVNSVGQGTGRVWANVTHFSTYALTGDTATIEEETPPATTSSGGGGGGGGGGAVLQSPTDNDSQTFTLRYVSAGEPIELSVERSEIPVTGVSFTSLEERLIGALTIERIEPRSVRGYTTHATVLIKSDIAAQDISIAFTGGEELLLGDAPLGASGGAAQSPRFGVFSVVTPERVAASAVQAAPESEEPAPIPSVDPGLGVDEESPVVVEESGDAATAILLALVVIVSLAIVVVMRTGTRKKRGRVREGEHA